MYDTTSCEHLSKFIRDLYFYRDPVEIQEEQAVAEKTVTMRSFRINGLQQISRLLLLSQRWQRSEGGQEPSVTSSSSLLKTGAPSQLLSIDQQLLQHRPPSGLEPPLSGPELLCRYLSKGGKRRENKFPKTWGAGRVSQLNIKRKENKEGRKEGSHS